MEEKKNLLIGAYSNYNYNQLKVWVQSAKQTGFDGDIVLIAFNTTQETVDALSKEGVIVILAKPSPNIPIHVERFIYIYDFLEKNQNKYGRVLTTDVKDVYFQRNPFHEIAADFYDLAVGTEGLLYKDEPWGNDNILQAFGPYFYERLKEKEICNVGVFGGPVLLVMDMCLMIFQMSLNRPIPIVDQAVFNFLLNIEYFKSKVWLYTHDNSFVCHLGTTMDPTKIEQFKPNLLCKLPTFDGELVKTFDGYAYNVVHQYDRVSELKEYVFNKFHVEDEAQKFIYRSE